jgi:hypothetical protein
VGERGRAFVPDFVLAVAGVDVVLFVAHGCGVRGGVVAWSAWFLLE